MLSGIIFDFDGTLFDTMGIWENAGAVFLGRLGIKASEGLGDKLSEMTIDEAASYLKAEYSLNMSESEIHRGINKTVEDYYLNDAKPKRGVNELLKKLKGTDIRMCIATASEKYLVEAALSRCSLKDCFPIIITCTDIGCGKGDALFFRKCAGILGTEISSTAVIEDSFHAAKTARNDGLKVVAVYDRYEKNGDALRNTAHLYLESFESFGVFEKIMAL